MADWIRTLEARPTSLLRQGSDLHPTSVAEGAPSQSASLVLSAHAHWRDQTTRGELGQRARVQGCRQLQCNQPKHPTTKFILTPRLTPLIPPHPVHWHHRTSASRSLAPSHLCIPVTGTIAPPHPGHWHHCTSPSRSLASKSSGLNPIGASLRPPGQK